MKKVIAKIPEAKPGRTYFVPQSLTEFKLRCQPPAGMTAMQAIMGKLDVEETTEELLAQLKAMG